MKDIVYFCVGVVVGVFLPLPYADQVRAWLLKLWTYISGLI
jgi:hypothetical protein